MEILDVGALQEPVEGVRGENVQTSCRVVVSFFFSFFQIVCYGEEDKASLARDSAPNCDLTTPYVPFAHLKKQTNISTAHTDEHRIKEPYSDVPVIMCNIKLVLLLYFKY